MVKSWLLNTVNHEMYDNIMYYDDAVEMWNDLYSRFRVSNLPRKYQLEQAIATFKQGSMGLGRRLLGSNCLTQRSPKQEDAIVIMLRS